MTTLIQNVRPYGQGEAVDVLIVDGVIDSIGSDIATDIATDAATDAATVIDGRNAVLLPGMVDLSANLGEPGHEETEDLTSGSRAAAKGGITAVVCQPNTTPVIDDIILAEAIALKAASIGLCDVVPAPAVTKGRRGEVLTEFGLLRDSDAHTTFFSEGKKSVANPVLLRRAMEYARGTDVTISEFCQDAALSENAHAHEGTYSGRAGIRGIPRSAEEIVVARDVCLAEEFQAKVHLATVSSRGSVDILRRAKDGRAAVTSSVAVPNLLFDDSHIAGYDSLYKVMPPLRTAEDRDALAQALVDGTIDCVVSDHTPVSEEFKNVEFDKATPGMIGLETTLPLLAELFVESGLADWRFIARVFSEAPARIAGLAEHGQEIAAGAPANLTLVAEDSAWTLEPEQLCSKSRNTPLLGKTFKAQVICTLLRGEVTYQA